MNRNQEESLSGISHKEPMQSSIIHDLVALEHLKLGKPFYGNLFLGQVF